MPLCISCGEPIPEGKRKHAVYCDSKCRGKQYRKRHPKPAATNGSCQPKTSTVLECPCGRRYLLSVTELHDHEAVTTDPPASVNQTVSNTEESWTERCHADDPSVAQTVLQAVSPNATQDRQAEPLPQDDTQTVSATTANTSDDGNNRDFDRIMWEHIEKLLPKVVRDLMSRDNATQGNKTTQER
jgi:hypothetical protein